MKYLLPIIFLMGCSTTPAQTNCDYVGMNILGWTCREYGNMTSDKGACQSCPETCVPIIETTLKTD